MNNVKTAERSRMQISIVNALLIVKINQSISCPEFYKEYPRKIMKKQIKSMNI